MNLEHILLSDHAKATTTAMARWIGSDSERFAILWGLFQSGRPPLPQRSAWVITYVCKAAAELRQSYVPQFIEVFLTERPHQAELRAMSQVLSWCTYTEEQMGQLVDLCFERMLSGDVPVAIKVHCMEILFNIVKAEPELAGELRVAIESRMANEQAGFRSRGRKILKGLDKL